MNALSSDISSQKIIKDDKYLYRKFFLFSYLSLQNLNVFFFFWSRNMGCREKGEAYREATKIYTPFEDFWFYYQRFSGFFPSKYIRTIILQCLHMNVNFILLRRIFCPVYVLYPYVSALIYGIAFYCKIFVKILLFFFYITINL